MTAMIETIVALIVVTVPMLAVIAIYAIAQLAIQSHKGGKPDCDRELLL